MDKLNFVGIVFVVFSSLAASAQAQNVTYKTTVSRFEMKTEQFDPEATCEEDVYFENLNCSPHVKGCVYTGSWKFYETRHTVGGYPGSHCQSGNGYVVIDRHTKSITKNTKHTKRLVEKRVMASATVWNPKGAAKECVQAEEQIARSVLEDDSVGRELGKLLKIKSVSIQLTDNTSKVAKDNSLKYGSDLQKDGKLVLRSVLNSVGPCLKVEKGELLDALAKRAQNSSENTLGQNASVENSTSATKTVSVGNSLPATQGVETKMGVR